jgi:hypothetical protein
MAATLSTLLLVLSIDALRTIFRFGALSASQVSVSFLAVIIPLIGMELFKLRFCRTAHAAA